MGNFYFLYNTSKIYSVLAIVRNENLLLFICKFISNKKKL